jgi:ribonucleoside-triphosphate reductase (thioredoxin)
MKITKIKEQESQFTVDIEVSNSHTYQLSNGCVSHNTVSQLVDSASGLHPRYAQYYIRRVRADGKDPLAKAMQEAGFPCEQDVMQPSNLVFSFPVKAPKNAVMRDDRTAIEQLEYWKLIQDEWCEHKPSVTIYVREHEWLEVGAWVYKHFDSVSGVSFLPHSDHSYMQAPYEECTWEQYETLKLQIPSEIPMSRLAELETSDMTTATQELSCTGGMCELV